MPLQSRKRGGRFTTVSVLLCVLLLAAAQWAPSTAMETPNSTQKDNSESGTDNQSSENTENLKSHPAYRLGVQEGMKMGASNANQNSRGSSEGSDDSNQDPTTELKRHPAYKLGEAAGFRSGLKAGAKVNMHSGSHFNQQMLGGGGMNTVPGFHGGFGSRFGNTMNPSGYGGMNSPMGGYGSMNGGFGGMTGYGGMNTGYGGMNTGYGGMNRGYGSMNPSFNNMNVGYGGMNSGYGGMGHGYGMQSGYGTTQMMSPFHQRLLFQSQMPMNPMQFQQHLMMSGHHGVMPRPGEPGYSAQLGQLLQNPMLAARMHEQGALRSMINKQVTQSNTMHSTNTQQNRQQQESSRRRRIDTTSKSENESDDKDDETDDESTTTSAPESEEEKKKKLEHAALHDIPSTKRAEGQLETSMVWK